MYLKQPPAFAITPSSWQDHMDGMMLDLQLSEWADVSTLLGSINYTIREPGRFLERVAELIDFTDQERAEFLALVTLVLAGDE